MPWQQLVADVGGELLPDGRPAYRDVIVTVPRQSGKTTLVLGWEIQRALGWGTPQRIVYSAQTGNDARKKLVEDQAPLINPHKSELGVRRILQGMGNESVEFVNGSRIVLLASSTDSGHGKTVDLGVKDELFADIDNRRDQALIPAMSTRPKAQVLTASTAGTDESVALNAEVARGRAAVDADLRTGTAYFEWSADPLMDLSVPSNWWTFMPALGLTIPEDAVAHAFSALSPGEFARAYGNVATRSDERIIPAALWDSVNSPLITPEGGLVFAVDVTPERSHAAIAVSDNRGRVEVLEHRPGTGWLVDQLVNLAGRWGGIVALDPSSPAGSYRDDLAKRLTVIDIVGKETAQACGAFFDDVTEGRAQIRHHVALDAAVAGARKRSAGDAWAWARKDLTVDVSPLWAATIARWVAMHNQPPVAGVVNLNDALDDDWDE